MYAGLSGSVVQGIIVLVCDGAAWHKSKALVVPQNIVLTGIPPYTPEMNPIEQVLRKIPTQGFHNEIFPLLNKAVDRLCQTINTLSNDTVVSITQENGYMQSLTEGSISYKPADFGLIHSAVSLPLIGIIGHAPVK